MILMFVMCFYCNSGKGLGKKEDGMRDTIKVNIKKSRTGVNSAIFLCTMFAVIFSC